MSTYVAIGSVCWDVVEGSDDARLGGSVLFASRVARAAGWQARIITSGTAELEAALRRAVPDVEVTVHRCEADTVMWFSRQADLGPQRVPSRADPIDVADLDVRRPAAATAGADVIHLAPIMGEITPEVVAAVAGAPFVGITPQGLLRDLDPDTAALLRHPHLDAWWATGVHAAVLSEDEYELVAEPAALDAVELAVTRGERGCVGRSSGRTVEVAGIDIAEVSPVGTIGAGDVFAASYFMALASGTGFDDALAIANRTAAAHVAGVPLPT